MGRWWCTGVRRAVGGHRGGQGGLARWPDLAGLARARVASSAAIVAAHNRDSDPTRRAERIRVAVAAATVVTADGAKVSGTVSIGVAGFPSSATDEDSLFRQADAALYDAKRHGTDRVFIAPVIPQ